MDTRSPPHPSPPPPHPSTTTHIDTTYQQPLYKFVVGHPTVAVAVNVLVKQVGQQLVGHGIDRDLAVAPHDGHEFCFVNGTTVVTVVVGKQFVKIHFSHVVSGTAQTIANHGNGTGQTSSGRVDGPAPSFVVFPRFRFARCGSTELR